MNDVPLPAQQLSSKKCPINFDHSSESHARNWIEEFKGIRETCPFAWTEAHGGFWVATGYNDVLKIAQNSDVFTTDKTIDPETGEVKGGVNIPPLPMMRTIPLESDMPEWQGFRSLINRHFAPKSVKARRDRIALFAKALLNEVIETGRIEFLADFTGPVAAMTTMDVLGIPLHEWRQFAEPLHEMVYWPRNSPAYLQKVADFEWVLKRVRQLVEERRANPKDDLISHIVTEPVNGEILTDELATEVVFNIIAGGVDTTTNLTAHVLKYLSDNPSEKQRLIENPDMLPVAMEEFVRFFSPVHGLARHAKQDFTLRETQIEKGDRILIAYGAANHDPEVFNDPDSIQMDRFPNRHIGFGAGMHRCAGSFLARIMFEVMITEILERMPDFRVVNDRATPYPAMTTINGWIEMPTVFTPGPRVAVDFVLHQDVATKTPAPASEKTI